MTDLEAKQVLEVMRVNADILDLSEIELTALSIAIENIERSERAKKNIKDKLAEWRSHNTRINYKSNFNMTYEIASVSGTIGGLKYALEELEKPLDANSWFVEGR